MKILHLTLEEKQIDRLGILSSESGFNSVEDYVMYLVEHSRRITLKETPESRTLRTHRNIFTFGDRYGVPIDSLDSPYTTPTKEMLDEKSNKLFMEKADE